MINIFRNQRINFECDEYLLNSRKKLCILWTFFKSDEEKIVFYDFFNSWTFFEFDEQNVHDFDKKIHTKKSKSKEEEREMKNEKGKEKSK